MLATRKLWIGFAVSVLLLALFLVTVDLGRMLTALAGANYVYLAPGLALYLISLLFRDSPVARDATSPARRAR